MPANETIRVHIPLTDRKRGGRPRILPPRDVETSDPPPGQDPRVLRAIGLAWAWRQRMERGEVTTIADLAAEEGLSDRYVSRLLRLACWRRTSSSGWSCAASPARSASTTSASWHPCLGTSSRRGYSTDAQ